MFFFGTFLDIVLYPLNIQSIWKNGPQVAPPLPVASMAGMAALPGRFRWAFHVGFAMIIDILSTNMYIYIYIYTHTYIIFIWRCISI